MQPVYANNGTGVRVGPFQMHNKLNPQLPFQNVTMKVSQEGMIGLCGESKKPKDVTIEIDGPEFALLDKHFIDYLRPRFPDKKIERVTSHGDSCFLIPNTTVAEVTATLAKPAVGTAPLLFTDQALATKFQEAGRAAQKHIDKKIGAAKNGGRVEQHTPWALFENEASWNDSITQLMEKQRAHAQKKPLATSRA